MRSFICGPVLMAVAVMAFGCECGTHTESATKSTTQTDKTAATKTCVLQSAGHDVLRLTVPADATCTPKDGSLDVVVHERYIEIWLVPGAQTVDVPVRRVDQVIKDEFKELKPTSKTDLAIAGATAKRMTGPGKEADDGDPGQADVIVFKVGEHVFVACTHGETLSPVAQETMLTVVRTAQGP